jgi:hypothetical protein
MTLARGITNYARFVVGYHGCDEQLSHDVLLGKKGMEESTNDYDWLGRGIYFWEQGPARAFQFAVDEAKRNSAKIKIPAVLGTYIYLGNCFDLLDTVYTDLLRVVYPIFRKEIKARGEEMPSNERKRPDGTKLFHRRDCAMINYTILLLENRGWPKFHTVRGAFWERKAAYAGAEIRQQSHIQIAVRDSSCILGYFKPAKLVGNSVDAPMQLEDSVG